MRKQKKRLMGAAIAVLGVLLTLQEFGVLRIDLVRYWPLLLVAYGLWVALN